MYLIKEVFIKVLQIVVIIAYVYVMMESWDASVRFHDERMSAHKAQCKQVYVERRVYHGKLCTECTGI